MAGLPTKVIDRATEILNFYIENNSTGEPKKVPTAENQISIFSKQDSELKQELTDLDVLSISPLEAIQKLDDLKKKYGL
jgi:DNA mismatch repair protein MutS